MASVRAGRETVGGAFRGLSARGLCTWQSQLGTLDTAEAQANTDIEADRTALKNNYLYDVQAANANVDSNYLQNYINQMNADRDYNYNRFIADRDYNFNRLNSDRNYDLDNKRYADSRTDTQRQQYLDTIGAYSNDYLAEIKRIQNNGDPSDDWKIPSLQQARREKIAVIQQRAEQKAALAETKAEIAAFKKALSQFIKDNKVTTQSQAYILGIPVGSKAEDYDTASIGSYLKM